MKDDDEQMQAKDSFDIVEDGAGTHNIRGLGTVVVDTSSPQAMLLGLVTTLGDIYGNQMFSNLTGIHMLDGVLIPSRITEWDTLH